jgi:hypothetical protein
MMEDHGDLERRASVQTGSTPPDRGNPWRGVFEEERWDPVPEKKRRPAAKAGPPGDGKKA